MSKCSIIVNFQIKDFEKLENSFPLTSFKIVTDDTFVMKEGKRLGYDIMWLGERYESANIMAYSDYEKGIKDLDIVKNWLDDIKYKNVSLIDYFKNDLLLRFSHLQQVKDILESKKDIIFLFNYFLYDYFIIEDLAKKLGYEIIYGISKIEDSNLQPIDFKITLNKTFKYLIQESEKPLFIENNQLLDEAVDSLIDEIVSTEPSIPEYAFFCTDNSYELYLRNIFPIIEKFREKNTPYLIFTFDEPSTINLEKRGYKVYKLDFKLYELSSYIFNRIPPLGAKDFEKLQQKISLQYKEKEYNIKNNISKLEEHLFPKPKVTIKTNFRKESSQNISPKFRTSNSERVYMMMLRTHSKYVKYKAIEKMSKILKPLFVHLEKKAQEQIKKREIERVAQIERQKQEEIERENQIRNETELMRKKQNELEAKRNAELDQSEIIKINKEINLIEEKIKLKELENIKEKELLKELEKIHVTPQQEILYNFINKIKNTTIDEPILQSFLSFFLDDTTILQLAKSITTISFLDKLFSRLKFKSLLVSSGGAPSMTLSCKVAQNHDIPNYLMTMRPYEEYIPIHKVILDANKIFVFGNRHKQELQHMGFDENQLIVIGSPDYDELNIKVSKLSDQILRKKTDRGLIIIAYTRWGENDEDWMPSLIKHCNQNNLDVFIKLHPIYKTWNKELSEQKIKAISERCKGIRVKISAEPDLLSLLPGASVLITEFSWAGFEASLCNVPLIVTNFQNKEFTTNALLYHKEGVALYATTPNELLTCLDKIISNSDIQSRLAEARRRLNYDFTYLNDGKAAERAYEILTKSDDK